MKVFIADFLPLANKGEEEILRGIETLYQIKTAESISFSVFGDVEDVQQVGNVTVYPRSICYPVASIGKFRKLAVIKNILKAVFGQLGYYSFSKSITSNVALMEDLRTSDKVLIGHDGFFNLNCALMGVFLQKQKIKYSILGAGFNKIRKKIAWAYNGLYAKVFDKADYVILREQTAFDYVREISKNKAVYLLPDPAFFCPADKFNRNTISNIETLYSFNSSLLKIGLTVCENSISFSRAFLDYKDRVKAHRELFVQLLSRLYDKYHCTFYFLPHCIEEGKGNDLVIARDIVSKLDKKIDAHIIEEDMPVLDIKQIISRMDFMIGERTHSIINSISTETPFINLTCSADFRTHDIVGKGCGLEDLIIDLDYPNIEDVFFKISSVIEKRNDVAKQLHNIYTIHKNKEQEFVNII